MCIVCIKPAGVARPDKETLNTMCQNNPDGFGYITWSEAGGLETRKTMSAKTFKKWVSRIPDEQVVVYHMRIATHGSVCKKNCHPFVSDEGKWAFAHNGILSIQNERDMTDSETFFRRLAIPLLSAGYRPNDNGVFDKMVHAIIGGSKFVFVDSKGVVYRYGDFIEDEGLLFSNLSYIPWGHTQTSKQTSVLDECDSNVFYALVDKIADDMMLDEEFYNKSAYQLYDEYKGNYPVSWNDFNLACDYAAQYVYQ